MLWEGFKGFHKGIEMDSLICLKYHSGWPWRVEFKGAMEEAGHSGQKLSPWSKQHNIMAGTRAAALAMKRSR